MRYSLHRCNSLYYLPSCVAPDVGGLPWTVPRPFHREPAIQGQASLSFPVVFSNTKQTDGRMNRISSSSVHLELEPGALGPLLQSYPDLVLLDFVRALVDFDFHGELGHGERVPSLAHDARHVEAELPEPDLEERAARGFFFSGFSVVRQRVVGRKIDVRCRRRRTLMQSWSTPWTPGIVRYTVTCWSPSLQLYLSMVTTVSVLFLSSNLTPAKAFSLPQASQRFPCGLLARVTTTLNIEHRMQNAERKGVCVSAHSLGLPLQ